MNKFFREFMARVTNVTGVLAMLGSLALAFYVGSTWMVGYPILGPVVSLAMIIVLVPLVITTTDAISDYFHSD